MDLVNKDNIRTAIDLFKDDNFIESKEVLQQEIKNARTKYLANKLDLEENKIDNKFSIDNDNDDNDDNNDNDD